MTTPRMILGDASGELVRRKIVMFRRLEPGDSMGAGSFPLRESPYLEGRVIEIALPKATHDDMVRLAGRRAAILGTASSSFLSRYDLAGMLLSGAGGGLFGVWLDYLPGYFAPYLLGALAVGVVLGFVTRVRKRAGELEAEERWRAAPERKDHEELARTLAEKWVAFSMDVKKESGFHTEVRVAEGSDDPLRLASIDPRGFVAIPPTFDPEDFLPTEGGGVRYEAVHAGGEVQTRLHEGDRDLPESYAASASDGASASASASDTVSASASASASASEPSEAAEPPTSENDSASESAS